MEFEVKPNVIFLHCQYPDPTAEVQLLLRSSTGKLSLLFSVFGVKTDNFFNDLVSCSKGRP